MVWDLGKALHKKEEFESARLMDFEFRQRARATRSLAAALGLDAKALVREIAERSEDEMLEKLATDTGRPVGEIAAEYTRCLAAARADLIAERGDPTPHRLG